MLAAAALNARNNIVKNQKDEVVTTSDKGGGTSSSFQNAPGKNFAVAKSSAIPEKPADWKKPDVSQYWYWMEIQFSLLEGRSRPHLFTLFSLLFYSEKVWWGYPQNDNRSRWARWSIGCST